METQMMTSDMDLALTALQICSLVTGRGFEVQSTAIEDDGRTVSITAKSTTENVVLVVDVSHTLSGQWELYAQASAADDHNLHGTTQFWEDDTRLYEGDINAVIDDALASEFESED